MGVRKTAIATTIGILIVTGAGASMIAASAHAAGGASPAATAAPGTTATMSAAEKGRVLAKLKAAKRQDKQELKDAPQTARAGYDAKIKELNRLIDKLNKSEDASLSEVEKAVAPPDDAAKSH